MELNIVGKTKAVKVSENTFGCKFNEALVHQVVTAYLAAGRAGTKGQKTRSEVSGGGVKPWRQKGTGRARAGTIRSPLWRHGGKVFAAVPRDYSQKVNRKMYDGALRAILSELVRQDRLIVIDELTLSEPKTRELTKKLEDLNLNKVLIVTDNIDRNLSLASRNLYQVEICDVKKINPVNLIASEKVLITEKALKQVEELLG